MYIAAQIACEDDCEMTVARIALVIPDIECAVHVIEDHIHEDYGRDEALLSIIVRLGERNEFSKAVTLLRILRASTSGSRQW
jgi:riboflavin synthase